MNLLERIQSKVTCELIYSHLQMFVISEDVGRKGLDDIID